ncbi:hypothetical protein D3C85_1294110 [compost metagenome]
MEAHDVGEGALVDRLRMRGGEVVALQITVVGDLPVGPGDLAVSTVMPVGETERLDILDHPGQEAGEIDLQSGGQHHENQTGTLVYRQLGQPHGRLVNVAVSVLTGDADQAAVVAIDPGMVRAGELIALATALCQFHRPVGADVEHRPDAAILQAGEQQRRAQQIERLVLPRQGDFTG